MFWIFLEAAKRCPRRRAAPSCRAAPLGAFGQTVMGKHEKKQAGREGGSQEQPRKGNHGRRQRHPRAKSRRETSLGEKACQERNHEGRHAWETRRQRQQRAKSWRETRLGDKAAAAAKSEITKGDKLGRQASAAANFRNQEPSHWEVRNPYSFQPL